MLIYNKFFCLFLFFIISFPFTTKASLEYNKNCQKIHSLLLSYKIDEAKYFIKKEKIENRANKVPYFLENYIDLFSLIFWGSEQKFEELYPNKEKRLNIIKLENPNSPLFLYLQAEIISQWAIIDLMYGNKYSGFFAIKKAYSLYEDNQKLYPQFIPNKKNLAVLQAGIGNLKGIGKSLASFFGYNFNTKKLKKEYTEYLEAIKTKKNLENLYYESAINYAIILFFVLNEQDKGWEEIKKITSDYPQNPISAYIRAFFAGKYNKKKSEVINILTNYKNAKNVFPIFHYFIAEGYLHKLNLQAEKYYKLFLYNKNNNLYTQDTYLKLSWVYFLKGDKSNFEKCRKLLKNSKNAKSSKDKNAINEVRFFDQLDKNLLKARLLFDGGNIEGSLKFLKPQKGRSDYQKMEYYYRLGRIYQLQNKNKKAIEAFFNVIYDYKHIKVYYLPASCLYVGKIFENNHIKDKAKQYFEMCLEYNHFQYKNFFEDRAKAGIKRISK